MNINWNLRNIFMVLMVFSVFAKVFGLGFVSEPNKPTIATAGSNQTFTWKLNLSEEDKSKKLQVLFGLWNLTGSLEKPTTRFITITRNNSQELEKIENQSIAQRLHWVGDLICDYFIAIELVNIQRDDVGVYGIRLRVHHEVPPPGYLRSWFNLTVEDPGTTQKKRKDTQHITVDAKEGRSFNITCRTSVGSSSSVIWTKNNVPVYRGHTEFLFFTSVNRSQAGNYVCVSINPCRNTTSPVTTVNVLYGPSIYSSSKQVSVPVLKGSSITLKCEADGNPFPTFLWYKNNKTINDSLNNSWNSSTLTVTPKDDEDFTSYVCKARNRIDSATLTFKLHGPHELETKKPSDAKESSLLKYVSIPMVLAVVLVCSFLIQRCVVKRYKRKHKNDATDDTEALHLSPTEAVYSEIDSLISGDTEWEIPRSHLKIEKMIGHGSFGVVSRGLAFNLRGRPGWTVVAVKSIQEGASGKERLDLLSEMSLLKHLDQHPHIIRLYACVTTEARPLVVVEYAQFGDLLGYLRKSRGMHDNYYSDPSIRPITSLTSKQLLKFSWEISDGMEYLSMKKIIHRDLAARNVLVGDGEVCKITDFGMARDVKDEDIYVRTHEGRLPIKWTAPEALFGGGAYTTASDVWSFGVVLYEIFTVGGDPFPGVYMKDMLVLLKNGYRMSRPKFISQKLYEVMMECWKSNSSDRPSFGCLSSQLQAMMIDEEQEYVNLAELLYENVLPASF